MPTDFTVPKTRVVASVGVIWACRPFLTEARSALPTVALTTQDDVEITTMSPVELDVARAGRAGAVPEPDPPPDPPDPCRSRSSCRPCRPW